MSPIEEIFWNFENFQKNLLDSDVEDKGKDIENVLKEIRGTARDGLSFLKVREMEKCFGSKWSHGFD